MTTQGSDQARTPHVVVVGGGFAGLAAVRRLGKAADETPMRITLLDRNNYHTFQPLLYQTATAGLEPQSIGASLRSIVRRLPVDVRMGEVQTIDWEDRRIELADGGSLRYDELVFAAGAETADYGIDGVAEHAFPLKWIPEATALRDHVLLQFEQVENDPSLIDQGALTFVIAGAGPTGVELSGAVAELIDHVVEHDHPQVDLSKARIVLVEMLDDVLPPYGPRSQRYARRALEGRGIEVRTGTAISEVTPDCVVLDDGERIPARTAVWTAGVRANPLADQLGVEQDGGGRIAVGRDLRLPGHPEVFVVGDVAAATDEAGDPLPQLAPVAIQQGKHAAEQIVRRRRGEPTTTFRYRDKGTMATIGRRDGVAELPFGLRLYGTVGWLAWLGLHLLFLAGFRNRLTVLINWTYNYVTYDRAARMILHPRRR